MVPDENGLPIASFAKIVRHYMVVRTLYVQTRGNDDHDKTQNYKAEYPGDAAE